MRLQEPIPVVGPGSPPVIAGVAALADAVQRGLAQQTLYQLLQRSPATEAEKAAQLLDVAQLQRLTHQPDRAAALEQAACALSPLFRVAGAAEPSGLLRVLALMAPGDLMVNTPLDFITRWLPVQLDLLYLRPGAPLPQSVPEHDIAFFAVSESDPAALDRLVPLYAGWMRPVLNDPRRARRLSRDGLPAVLQNIDGLQCPAAQIAERSALAKALTSTGFPAVIRPLGSHAGHNLVRLPNAEAGEIYLASVSDATFFVSPFIDYGSRDRLFRKYRLVMIDGEPLLCHLAVSSHWMVHYMSAGMAEDASKRAEEAAAMADFENGFATRHRLALDAMHARIGLDYYQVDCAELPDGQLLIFEADVAAIVHMLDPPALFPYKAPQMRRIFSAFGAMLARRAPSPVPDVQSLA